MFNAFLIAFGNAVFKLLYWLPRALLGPGPGGRTVALRDDTSHLWRGLPDLSEVDVERVRLGNRLLANSCVLALEAIRLGIPVLLENSATSRLWLTRCIKRLVAEGAVIVRTDFCQYGVPWRKATNFLCAYMPAPVLDRCKGGVFVAKPVFSARPVER